MRTVDEITITWQCPICRLVVHRKPSEPKPEKCPNCKQGHTEMREVEYRD